MANIIAILNREIEKNNLYLDEKGNTINPDKLERVVKKSYVSDLKAGNIDFYTSFEEYYTGVLESYLPVTALIDVIKDTLRYEEQWTDTTMPPAENIAT